MTDAPDVVREIDGVWEAIISAPFMRISLLTPLRDIALRLAGENAELSNARELWVNAEQENARLKAEVERLKDSIRRCLDKTKWAFHD